MGVGAQVGRASMPCLASSQVHGEGFCSRAILGLSGGFSCTKNTKVMNEEHFPSTPLTGDVSLILQIMFLQFFQQIYVVAAAKGHSALQELPRKTRKKMPRCSPQADETMVTTRDPPLKAEI